MCYNGCPITQHKGISLYTHAVMCYSGCPITQHKGSSLYTHAVMCYRSLPTLVSARCQSQDNISNDFNLLLIFFIMDKIERIYRKLILFIINMRLPIILHFAFSFTNPEPK